MLEECLLKLKVLSYWNLNYFNQKGKLQFRKLKVLSYWNLNLTLLSLTSIIP